MDELSHEYLSKFSSDITRVISHDVFALEELKKLRSERSTGEYCWTAKPIVLEYILKKYINANWAFYLDADAMFFSSLDDHLVRCTLPYIITPHNFSSSYKKLEKVVGSYNAGFVGIKNKTIGLEALKIWKQSCLSKCSSKPDVNTYADQKYLNEFGEISDLMEQFPSLLGVNVAPWNIEKFALSRGPNGLIMVDSEPLIFYHFQGLKLKKGSSTLYAGNYQLTDIVKENIYLPYITQLKGAFQLIRASIEGFNFGIESSPIGWRRVKEMSKKIIRPTKNLIDFNI
jgi:hypothetical protein